VSQCHLPALWQSIAGQVDRG